jgi:hypothetical protein
MKSSAAKLPFLRTRRTHSESRSCLAARGVRSWGGGATAPVHVLGLIVALVAPGRQVAAVVHRAGRAGDATWRGVLCQLSGRAFLSVEREGRPLTLRGVRLRRLAGGTHPGDYRGEVCRGELLVVRAEDTVVPAPPSHIIHTSSRVRVRVEIMGPGK